MEVYLDNAATTEVSEGAVEAMISVLRGNFGNPSSLHAKGFSAEKEVENSRQIIASAIKGSKVDLYFTSGGTESNNMAIRGIALAYARRGKHILVSDIEHPSVKDAAFKLEEDGFEIEVIPSTSSGYIEPEVVKSMVREDTILVGVMHINNEIGTIQPIDDIVKAVKSANSQTMIHVDAVQSFGKYPLFPARIGVDTMSISAHKIHGPKGSGALWVSPKIRLKPLMHGGDQQKGMRSGTENVSGIAGFGKATEEAYKALDARQKHIGDIRHYCINQLQTVVDDVIFNSDIDNGAGHILNIRIMGVKSEVLMHSLEDAMVYVSTGSACSSNKKHHSSTLQAMGQDAEATDQAIRLSFSKDSTMAEVDVLIEKMVQVVPLLRRFRKK